MSIPNIPELKNFSLAKTNMANIFSIVKDKNNNYVFNINDTLNIQPTDTSTNYYIIHYVHNKESYQSISFYYYGTTRLWWIITKFNNIQNVIDLPKPGTALKILKPEMKDFILNSMQNI